MNAKFFKILAWMGFLFLALNCARREKTETIITTTKPEAATTTTIISGSKPSGEGGTVIMATAPGATPPPAASPAPALPPEAPSNTSANINAATVPINQAVVAAAVPIAPPPTAVEVGTLSVPEKVGLLTCDSYVDRYVTCINKNVPKDRQAPLIQGLELDVKRWQGMMGNAQGKNDAANECLRALDRTRQAMTPYSCTWE